MNAVLDQLDREDFYSADVFIKPPDNNESDGDSENSDDEQSVARPFADHLAPQILKGEGSVPVAILDEGGRDELGIWNDTADGDEQLSVSIAGGNADAATSFQILCQSRVQKGSGRV